MKYFYTLFLFFFIFLLPGGEKWTPPARVSLLYDGVPGKLFSRLRPPADIRLTIRKAGKEELLLLKKGKFTSSDTTLFLLPQKALPAAIPPESLLFAFALKGKLLSRPPGGTLQDLPTGTALALLKGEIGYREKLPGKNPPGRLTLYGTKDLLPLSSSGKKGPILIPTASSRKTGELLMLDPEGLGVFPLTFLEEKSLFHLSINRIPPTPENLTSGKYPLAEKLFLYAPPSGEKEKKLLAGLKEVLMSRPFHIELLYMGLLPLPPAEKP